MNKGKLLDHAIKYATYLSFVFHVSKFIFLLYFYAGLTIKEQEKLQLGLYRKAYLY
jgi:hypothetical protein